MGLKEYKAKRNFDHSREPAGKVHAPKKHAPLFVVQKHAARRLHYDWRLAVQVEDHPIEYADFEGTIPEGSYGAGTVMVWDTGTYEVAGDEPGQALEKGKLHLLLMGRKLKG